MATHDLNFDVSHNGVAQPPSHDQQQMGMSGSMDMTGGNSGSGGYMDRLNSESAHPTACIFHVVFKMAAMFLYIFGGWFSGSNNKGKASGAGFVIVAVFCILLLAVDFWVVKTITGRLLVGLRWWNKVEGDNTRWIYESAENEAQYNKFDSTIFWWVLSAKRKIWQIYKLVLFNYISCKTKGLYWSKYGREMGFQSMIGNIL